jgi:hypothetical protein
MIFEIGEFNVNILLHKTCILWTPTPFICSTFLSDTSACLREIRADAFVPTSSFESDGPAGYVTA